MTTRFRAPLAAGLIAALLTTGFALAQTPAAVTDPATPMSFQQVIDKVTAQGFRDVREIERKSDKLYEVKARDDKGQWVELYVDARSGEVLRREVKRKSH